jgi:hypothetical protein
MAGIDNRELALWYLSLALQVTILVHLVVRRLLSVFPGLLGYLTVNVLKSCLLMVLLSLGN